MKRIDPRKKKRISMIAAALVRPSSTGIPIEAQIINVSYGGVGIYIKEPVQGRVQIVISLKVGPDREVAQTVWGNVIWKEPVGSSYAIGISFEELNHRDHSLLLSFLEKASAYSSASQALELLMRLKSKWATSHRSLNSVHDVLNILNEDISKRAFEIYEQHGREAGREQENWLEAERQVFAELKEPAFGQPRAPRQKTKPTSRKTRIRSVSLRSNP